MMALLCFRQSRRSFRNRLERRKPWKPGSASLARSYLPNNFVHPLDGGYEVCMIRNKKSH
jgi:hypothetical protein